MGTTGTSLRVLIADQSRDFQAVAKTWLERHPSVSSVRAVGSATEALAAAERNDIDLVLIDAVFSDLDGFETTRRVKTAPNPPLVVIMVLYDFAAVRDEAERAGADACVDKSALTQSLAPVLDEFVAKRDARRAPGEQSTKL